MDHPDLDETAFAELRGDVGDEALALIIETFLSDTADAAAQIVATSRDGGDALRRSAHALKGPVRMLGGTRLASTCQILEDMGMGRVDGDPSPIAARVEAELNEFRRLLSDRRREILERT